MLRHQRLHPAHNVLFSSRRRGSRRTRSASSAGQTRIPDWAWGGALGLIVIVAIGGYFLLSGGGNGGGTCDSALAPLGSSTINQQTLNDEDAGLGRVIDMLNSGDRSGAEQAFYGPVHNFTHNVDPPLREKDPAAAKGLCKEVLNVEELLQNRAPNDQISRSLTLIRQYIADGAVELGYDRPSGLMEIHTPTDRRGMQYARST